MVFLYTICFYDQCLFNIIVLPCLPESYLFCAQSFVLLFIFFCQPLWFTSRPGPGIRPKGGVSVFFLIIIILSFIIFVNPSFALYFLLYFPVRNVKDMKHTFETGSFSSSLFCGSFAARVCKIKRIL